MPDITHLVNIEAAPGRVFEALTRVEDVRQWWTREADLDPYVGGKGEMRFYDGTVPGLWRHLLSRRLS